MDMIDIERIWREIRRVPAWLSYAMETPGITQADCEAMSDMEDSWRSAIRGRGPAGIDYGLVEEVCKANPDWVRERRSEYLRDEIARKRKGLAEDRICIGRFVMAGYGGEAESHLLGIKDTEEGIRKMERDLSVIASEVGRPHREWGYSSEQIGEVKDYPLWRFLGKNQNDKVKCIMHEDANPSVNLYEKHGYCFVCCKKISTIDWVMKTQGVKFLDAVGIINDKSQALSDRRHRRTYRSSNRRA